MAVTLRDEVTIMNPEPPEKDNGWHHATCPECRQRYTWSTAAKPDKRLRCDNEIEVDGKKKRCPQTYLTMEWEYLKWQEQKREAVA